MDLNAQNGQCLLAHNTTALFQLCKCCPGESKKHKHKPWGVVTDSNGHKKFSTAEETAYPMPLAYAIAFHLAHELMARGWQPPDIAFTSPDAVSYQYLRAVVGQQPKASKIPPLLSEFSHVVKIAANPNQMPPVLPGSQLQSEWNGIPPWVPTSYQTATPVKKG